MGMSSTLKEPENNPVKKDNFNTKELHAAIYFPNYSELLT